MRTSTCQSVESAQVCGFVSRGDALPTPKGTLTCVSVVLEKELLSRRQVVAGQQEGGQLRAQAGVCCFNVDGGLMGAPTVREVRGPLGLVCKRLESPW